MILNELSVESCQTAIMWKEYEFNVIQSQNVFFSSEDGFKRATSFSVITVVCYPL